MARWVELVCGACGLRQMASTSTAADASKHNLEDGQDDDCEFFIYKIYKKVKKICTVRCTLKLI